jgi:hypothetical protein
VTAQAWGRRSRRAPVTTLPAIGTAIGRAYLPDLTAGQMARLGGRLLVPAERPPARASV